ncbi:MAG: sugar nucleotide-binding protein, partial [Bacteroidetes bacterium]|nr:sugar nucleotide-binding protein [Bacteroidota bacterium]
MGKAFARVCEHRGIVFQLLTREQIDIASMKSLERYLEKVKPWAIINAAGFTDIDQAEINPKICFRENTIGPENLATICLSAGIK